MKKRFFILILSLLLALSTASCGTQSADGNATVKDTPDGSAADSSGFVQNASDDSNLNTPAGIGTGSSGLNAPIGSGLDLSGLAGIEDSSLSFSSLTDFYNSEYRTQAEEALNEIFTEAFGLRIYFTIQEPDTLIFNYQFVFPLSSVGLSQEETTAALASSMQESTSAETNELINYMKTFQSYGLPLKVIRLNFLDEDGSLLYSTDVTEKGSSGLPDNSGLPDSSGTTPGVYADLQDWISSSEDAASTVHSTNQSLASTGITFDLTVDGSILVYQYYLPDGYFKDGLAEEDLAAAFDSMVEAGSASVDTIVSVFMDKYGLTVDAVRFAYYSKDGTELYSRDVRP